MEPAHRLSGIAPSLIRQIHQSAPKGAINLGLGEITLPHPPALQTAINRIMRDNIHSYTPNAGLPELRDAVAQHHAVSSSAGVCITNGAEEALYCTLMSYINPGDQVLIADPTFLAYEVIIKMAGGIPQRFLLPADKGFALDAESFASSISDTTKAVVLCHPANPSGVAFTESEMQYISSLCQSHNVLLIVDEIYRELVIDQPIPSFSSYCKNCIILGGISKSHGLTGWRLGWCYSANQALVLPIITTHQYVSTCAPTPSQHVALWALTSEGQQITEQLRAQLMANRTTLLHRLTSQMPSLRVAPASAHPYALVHMPHQDVYALASSLAKQGVITVPGCAFGAESLHWLRITYASDPEDLAIGLNRMLPILQNTYPELSD